MPSHQRSSPSSGRRPESALDTEQSLRDALTKARTELNKATGEKDRFETSCDQLKKRLSETANVNRDLKSQLQSASDDRNTYKERYQQSEENYAALNEIWLQRYKELEAKYHNLIEAYDEIQASSVSSPMTSSLPDRSKEPRSSAKKDDRGRARDKDREREKREKREQKAEKERLGKRFENRPPTSNRRSSYIDGWGPGGRSASANPLSRPQYSNAPASGRTAPQHGAQYSGYTGQNVPRTNPLSPSGVYSSGSSAVYDDEHEDGNYHHYPIQR